MYERFTDRARKVMQLANQEAQRFNHEYIGTEHILLGLVKEGSGVAANVLKNLDIDLRKIRLEVEKIVQSGPDMVTMGKLPQTPRAKKVIEYSIEEARDLNHNYVGTEHLLLGLLREEEGVAAQVLMNSGVSLERARQEVLNLLASTALLHPEAAAPAPPAPAAPPTPVPENRFTKRTRAVMELARQEAERLRREMIATEHILCGVLQGDEGSVARVLLDSGVDLAKLRAAMATKAAPGPYGVPVSGLPLTDRARQVLAFAAEEADRLGEAGIAPGHLVLGILRDREGAAVTLLAELAINPVQVEKGVRYALLCRGFHRRPPSRRDRLGGTDRWLLEMEQRYLVAAWPAREY